MSIEQLITEHLDIWTAADTEKKSGRGRSSGSAGGVYGIKKLRELILELAVRGKLVPQDASDEPASELLKRIAAEKAKLVAEGKIKKSKPLAEITDDEKPFVLPVGWEWVRLIDLASLITKGSSPKWQGVSYSNNPDDIMFVTSENVGSYKLLLDSPKYVERKFNDIEPRSILKNGDFLMNIVGASIGRTALYDLDTLANINQAVCLIRIATFNLSSMFLLHFFNSETCLEYMLDKQVDNARPNLSMGNIATFLISIPPLAEQHRIVAKVDELMALCDQLENQHNNAAEAHEKLVTHLLGTLTQSQIAEEFKTNWQRISEHFDTLFTTEASIDALKQTLLQLAVMGKLVPQDPNDEPASELLKRIQAEKAKLIAEGKIKKDKSLAEITEEEKPFDLPVGWEWVRLDEISHVGTGATPLRTKPEYFEPSEFSWVTSGETSNPYVFATEQYVSTLALKETNLTIYPKGTLVVAMYGQGKTRGQITELMIDACTNQACAAIRLFNADKLHRKYVKYFFEKTYDEIRELAAGGAQPNLNLSKIKDTLLPLPPLNEQYRIVTKVDELMATCHQLKATIISSNQLQQKIADVLIVQTVN